MTALESVARRMHPELWAKIDRYANDDDWNGGTALNARQTSLSEARAAAQALFAALEEPSEGMVKAGEATGRDQHCAGEGGNWHEWREHDPEDVWRAMLERAKREMLG